MPRAAGPRADGAQDIFVLLVTKILPQLAEPANPYNSQHLYALKSLAEVQSIVLLADLPSPKHLVSSLFQTCFDVLSTPSRADHGPEPNRNIEHYMTTVLSVVVDEMPTLPADVVDSILAQFLRVDPAVLSAGAAKDKKSAKSAVDARQTTLLLKEAPPAYNMAKNICNTCPEKMARLVGTYFSSVMVDTAAQDAPRHPRRRPSDDAEPSDDAPRRSRTRT